MPVCRYGMPTPYETSRDSAAFELRSVGYVTSTMSSPSVDKSEYDTGLAEDDDDDGDANFVNAVLFPCIVPESCCLRLRAVIDEDEDESDDEWGTSIPSSSSSSSSLSFLRRDFAITVEAIGPCCRQYL